MEAKRKESAVHVVWPCRLKILKPFATRDPIILGCDVRSSRQAHRTS
jgi:translation initiation factor 5B